jgi:hypothetical protein
MPVPGNTGLNSPLVGYLGVPPPGGPAPPNNAYITLVPYVEYRSESEFVSPRESYELDKTSIVRQFLVDYDLRFAAQKALLGFPLVSGLPVDAGGSPITGANRYIQRQPPTPIPWLTTDEGGFSQPRYYLWCTSADIEGKGDIPDDGVTVDQWLANRCGTAIITATFNVVSYDVLGDQDMLNLGYVDIYNQPDESWVRSAAGIGRYVTIESNPSSRYQTLPASSFCLVAGNPGGPGNGTIYPGTPGRLEVEADFAIVHHSVPLGAVPFRLLNPWIANTVGGQPYTPAIEDCLGCVNLYDFAGCKKGTLLLVAAIMKRTRSPLGMRLYDIELRFRWFGAQNIASLSTAGITPQGGPGAGALLPSYGHNLVLYLSNAASPINSVGYYEAVANPVGGPNAAASNYALFNPQPNVNIFNYKSFEALFRVPQLFFDPGNT